MEDILDLLAQADTHIAVVGATDNRAKFGAVIYRDLKRKGYRVFPVNPHRITVDGDKCYASLKDLPKQPEVVNIVVNPQQTLEVLHECVNLGLLNVWLQPGAENPQVLSFLQEQHFNYLANACIMVETRMK